VVAPTSEQLSDYRTKVALVWSFMESTGSREAFPLLMNYLGLQNTGSGGEVGVGDFSYSDRMLRLWKPNYWTAVDILKPAVYMKRAESFVRHQFNVSLTLHQGKSWKVAGKLGEGSFDFLYIDASHQYKSVKKDLKAYFPKIKPGGILAGHDFCGTKKKRSLHMSGEQIDVPWCGRYSIKSHSKRWSKMGKEVHNQIGVVRAILEFARAEGISVDFTREDQRPNDLYSDHGGPAPHLNPSWYLLKPW